MTPIKSPLPAEATEEISTLVTALQRTQRRLEELTAGEVDTVTDRDGRPFMLRRARDRTRHDEAARQDAILGALPAHIALLDAQGRIVTVNEAWRQFGSARTAQRPGYAIGVNYLEICDSAQGDDSSEAHRIAEGVRSVLSGEAKRFSIEYPCHTATKQRWFLMTVTPLGDHRPDGAVVMHLDVTERTRTAEALLRFVTAMDAIGDAIYLVDRSSMRYVHVNTSACRLQQLTREELLLQEPWQAASASRAELERTYDGVIAGGVAAQPVEILRRRKDGSQGWDELRRHALNSGKSWTIVTLVRDITERKRTAQELHRFRAAMDISGDAIVLVDRASMRYIDVNQTLCELVGRTRQELLGISPMELFSASRETLERDYDALIADNHSSASKVEGHFHHRDGSLVPVESRRRALHTDDGWIIVATMRGVGERKEAEARILYLNRVHAMLSGINALIVRVLDRDELFREACRIAVEAGGFHMAMIKIVDRSTLQIVPIASAGADAELLGSIQGLFSSSEGALAGNTLTARAIREKKVLLSNDSQRDPRVLLGKEHAQFGVRSMAMLPLIVADEAVGALVLHASEIEFFHAEELKLLTDLAGNIAFAIDHIAKEAERRDAEARIVRLNRVYAVLSGINTLIVRVRDREELFSEACRVAVEHGQFKMAWIGIVDRGAMKIVPVASAGAEPEFLTLIKDRFSLREDSPMGNTMSARAVRDKKAVVSNEMRGDSKILFAKERIERGISSMAILPLLIADDAVGVLALYAGETGFFDQQEMKLLTGLAGDIAHAIDHIDKQERLDYLAYYDVLTGLANRSLFLERVAQYVRSASGGAHRLAVFLIDLERFRNINDSLGRPAGDALLKQVAEWLTRNVGGADVLARVGSDQFALVLPEVRQAGSVARLLEKRLASFMEHPFRLDDAVFRIAFKAGIALFPDDGADADTLFRNAEAALKKAKAGGERYLFYTQKMTEAVAGKLTLENQLRQALERGEFALHYQPKVSLASGKLTGAEALIRWNDPRTGLVPPGRFIPILEETGLIYDVGRWALRKAIQDYLRWRAAGLDVVRIAVNVSPLQLRNRGFVAEIQEAIGIDAQAAAGLDLEITESLIMEDIKHSIASLQAIRAMGVTVAIDDFGTGFSSLSYLSKLPVDTLKIDRSFVTDMTVAPGGLALVSTVINLAHSLKLKVVAEGVETQEQQRLLRLLRCDEMQGFLYSKPLPCELFETKFLAPVATA